MESDFNVCGVKLAVQWLHVSAIIAEFNMGCYGCALTWCLSAYLVCTSKTPYVAIDERDLVRSIHLFLFSCVH